MPSFDIPITRSGHGCATIHIQEAKSRTQAEHMALDSAGDTLFTEKVSDYALSDGPSFDELHTKKLYLGTSCDDSAVNAPAFVSIDATPGLYARLDELTHLCRVHGLESITVDINSLHAAQPTWGSNDFRLGWASLTVTRTGVAISALPSDFGYAIESHEFPLAELFNAMQAPGDEPVYLGNDTDSIQQCVEDSLDDLEPQGTRFEAAAPSFS